MPLVTAQSSVLLVLCHFPNRPSVPGLFVLLVLHEELGALRQNRRIASEIRPTRATAVPVGRVQGGGLRVIAWKRD